MLHKLIRESLIAQIVVLCLAFGVIVTASWCFVYVDESRMSVTALELGKSAAHDGLRRSDCPFKKERDRTAWVSGYDMVREDISRRTNPPE